MATYIWVNIDADNGLMPGGAKPLPELMLTLVEIMVSALTDSSIER